ncbi:glycogen synthase GlgA [Candidatus Desantisbacteria bacterium CG_4_10_14_0_8_um_filter_48_22]|uniref:Glycogen synthase n=1 Tax=Candidatus Desantisbacteria bacterium CG_4_10_14_0_8_um_filter_48_22 TaxID=1974543 RepID=A0A2M7SDR1_9BACT|nr:MAG: starch synthase [Candidatus Desantisbacteria bacterium CG1_02_49_89]PIV57344.1 MAG: glycogen synthase GlgA [Candidatus Desantisbacteria bacterium CG02_land_8_20_14_3_00_49_13]PIZ17624.1 MAG: glycogen synthase GlgA [Candidatus Desantisbacteria bacterium CG_4_10_14_0_8_um_filter_48_22]PJB28389.1 MAG: glycogen synthase GlgA [Candidatus Desantisbacteria bacterium CG_4_9_14_3_um_filter_50_7]
MKVLIVASEVVPFAKTGGLADVAGALPKALKSLGVDVRVAMPRHKCVSDGKFGLKPSHISPLSFDVQTGLSTERANLRTGSISAGPSGGEIPVYFIENNKYFDRDALYGDQHGDYPDNGLRFSFFCRSVLESLRVSLFQPDVIHCNDWQTGLIPAYLKTIYGEDLYLKGIKTLYTIHNIAYQGLFEPGIMDYAGLNKSLFNFRQLEFYGKMNFAKAGLVFADAINTVSEKYAGEIMTPDFGCKLEGVLKERSGDVYGIINGIDYEEWNPSTDGSLKTAYDGNMLEGKLENKKALQAESGLPVDSGVPLFGFVGRLAAQKGLDILSEALPGLLEEDVQVVMLGKGDTSYEKLCGEIAAKYPKKVKVILGFDVAMSHRIYAGSDFFLMPSFFEPCGLGQMIAMRYGSIPVVHYTGGLADTVAVYNEVTGGGNGFVFKRYSAAKLLATLKNALGVFRSKERWLGLVRQAMGYRFSWEKSAKKYLELYNKIMSAEL